MLSLGNFMLSQRYHAVLCCSKLKFIFFNFKLSDSLALTVSKYEWKL